MKLCEARNKLRWLVWLWFYNLFGMKWWSCDYNGIQCRVCGRKKLCDYMTRIGTKHVFWSP